MMAIFQQFFQTIQLMITLINKENGLVRTC